MAIIPRVAYGPNVDYDEHVDAVEREISSIVQAFRDGNMAATVPTCPDWTLRDLAKHVGEFTGLWTHVVCEGTGREKTPYSDIPADDTAIAAWYQELGGHLVEELRATPPATEVWTWSDEDGTAKFAARRCAHELAIHRFDVQTVSGQQHGVDAELAADGIDEIFMMIRAWGAPPEGSGRSLHVHGTDNGDEWIISLLPEGIDVRREHGRADMTLSGNVSDLELTLLQRPPLGPVKKEGDDDTLDAWYRQFTFG
jgi:uncharacterized protein (TIGR03083 family)